MGAEASAQRCETVLKKSGTHEGVKVGVGDFDHAEGALARHFAEVARELEREGGCRTYSRNSHKLYRQDSAVYSAHN